MRPGAGGSARATWELPKASSSVLGPAALLLDEGEGDDSLDGSVCSGVG